MQEGCQGAAVTSWDRSPINVSPPQVQVFTCLHLLCCMEVHLGGPLGAKARAEAAVGVG